MFSCFFVSDLHGKTDRYDKLFDSVRRYQPKAVFLGGDLLPFHFRKKDSLEGGFIDDYLYPNLLQLKTDLNEGYPEIFLIMGNDDPRFEEAAIVEAAESGLFKYIHKKKVKLHNWDIYGYAYIPPTPFMLKDWERYDVSRYVDPGCYPPERGKHTVKITENKLKYYTILKGLNELANDNPMENAVFLFHAPPYKTKLDRAALDGKYIDGVPLDPHIGSIAIERFIKERQPLLTLHGHVHESTKITGSWRDKFGRTIMFNAAHHGGELSLIKFDLENPDNANRVLL